MRLLGLWLSLLIAMPAAAQHWTRSWAAAPSGSGDAVARAPSPPLADRTLRQVVRVSIGGTKLRVRLSNEERANPIAIGAVHVALAGADGAIVAGSDRIVTFDGTGSTVIPAFSPMLSDPIAMRVPALGKIAISLYLANDAHDATGHDYANGAGWIAPGDQIGATRLRDAVVYRHRLVVSALDVDRPDGGGIVVALGDSITDGGLATEDADRRWPDRLAERLHRAGATDIGIANAGISGNQLLASAAGRGMLARFDRDVIAVPGARDVIVLGEINDITRGIDHHALPQAPALIAGYRQIIARGHAAGLRVYLATLTPYRVETLGTDGEAVRQAVNAWIRRNGESDGAIDFDRAIRDPADPSRMAAVYDSGDHLHPNDAGMAAMAAAIDIGRLK